MGAPGRSPAGLLVLPRKALAKRYSQLKPTRAKLENPNLHRWVAKRYRQVEKARKKTIQFSDYESPNNKTTWLELAKVAKRWNTWLELGENLTLIKFKPTRANSSQLKPSEWPKRYPTPSKLWTWLELAWVGSTVWPGLKTCCKHARLITHRLIEPPDSRCTAPNWGQFGNLRLIFPSTLKPNQASTTVSLSRNTIVTTVKF